MIQLRILLKVTVALLIVIAITPSLRAQGYLTTYNNQIVDGNGNPFFLKGMGLGGWMVQEGYMMQTAEFANPQHKLRATIQELIGEEETDIFYERWLRNHVTKADIDALAEWGFNSVRLPMHYNLYTLPLEEEPVLNEHTWLDIGFELTDSIISWCKANEMYVILDLHAAPGGQGYDAGISDYDDTKPSLWQSKGNRDKTVALWKRLAERYKDEPWVGGYDLINEVNWDLPGGNLLKSLYKEITDSIRTVDQDHIIFIEGNWFANDFTGLTPPWDDNMVYSPHKYWSINDQASIQWVLDMRNSYNIPLYLGETGENSNTWFTDAINLFDDNQIGWAWWPMKKIESISGPLSITKPAGYDELLDYWKGNGPKPSQTFAVTVLEDLIENIKFENCVYQKDVIDAMFRQTKESVSIPFTDHAVPGKIYAANFDLGGQGVSYYDMDVATYHVSTGNFTAWNTGWAYRNDGVDIEPTEDLQNELGFNVGWTDREEWMNYTVNVTESGLYDITVRLAGGANGGLFRLQVDGADVSDRVPVPNTGGYQNWQNIKVENIVLEAGTSTFTFNVDNSGYNISSYTFEKVGESTDTETVFVGGETIDENNIQIDINKELEAIADTDISNFDVSVNGVSTTLSSIALAESKRSILLTTEAELVAGYLIKVSYDGNSILATDGLPLMPFSFVDIRNTVTAQLAIPGLIEAEEFVAQSGIQLEETTDDGGGQNIGYLDVGDYCDYEVDIKFYGTYDVSFRTASQGSEGEVGLTLIDDDGNENILGRYTFPNTGGWQSWTTTTEQIVLPKGRFILRMDIKQPNFNINWVDFNFLTHTGEDITDDPQLYPNPSSGIITIPTMGQFVNCVFLYDVNGKLVDQKMDFPDSKFIQIDYSRIESGPYIISIESKDGTNSSQPLILK